MNKLFIALGVVVVVLSAAAGVYFWLRAPGGGQGACGDGVCDAFEKSAGVCPQDCSGAQEQVNNPAGKITLADNFIWGTELVSIEPAIADYITRDLGIKYVKVRLRKSWFTKDGGKTYTNNMCPPIKDVPCENYDDFAAVFKKNSWSMMPMLMAESNSDNDKNDANADNYANFLDWFVARYKTDASIKYIEGINAPGGNWKGTDKQLAAVNDKIYAKIKSKYPEILIGTPGFEYMFDESTDPLSKNTFSQMEYFLDKNNDVKFDFWAFHGYACAGFGDNGAMGNYPPTRTPTKNKYCGIAGINEIRSRLDANGWTDRKIIDTEHVGTSPIGTPDGKRVTEFEDDDAAYIVQDALLKFTLQHNGKQTLSGIFTLKMNSRGKVGEVTWSSWNSDGTTSYGVRAYKLFLSKIREYNYESRVSGAFDRPGIVWMEKFKAPSADKELYIFFKPFPNNSVKIDGQTLNYTLTLSKMPVSVELTALDGQQSSIAPAWSIDLAAVNAPQFLEVAY